jgi:hypothetical protein
VAVKIRIDVDCTPEEARHFFGLPDLRPIQDAVLAKIERQMLEAAEAMSPESMLRAWLPLIPQSQEQMQKLFAALFQVPFGAANSTKPKNER